MVLVMLFDFVGVGCSGVSAAQDAQVPADKDKNKTADMNVLIALAAQQLRTDPRIALVSRMVVDRP